MKLSQYIKHLQALEANGAGDFNCYYSVDEEGSEFKPMTFEPGVMLGKDIGGNEEKVIVIN